MNTREKALAEALKNLIREVTEEPLSHKVAVAAGEGAKALAMPSDPDYKAECDRLQAIVDGCPEPITEAYPAGDDNVCDPLDWEYADYYLDHIAPAKKEKP